MPAPLSIIVTLPPVVGEAEPALGMSLAPLSEAIFGGLIADVTFVWAGDGVPDWLEDVAEETGAMCQTAGSNRLDMGNGPWRVIVPAGVILPSGWSGFAMRHIERAGGPALFRNGGVLDPLRARLSRPARDHVQLLPRQAGARFALIPARTMRG